MYYVVHRLTFFINTPSYNRDCLESIHKNATYERSKYTYCGYLSFLKIIS